VLLKTGITVISDEIYEKLVYAVSNSAASRQLTQKLKGQAIVVNGVSKILFMTRLENRLCCRPEADYNRHDQHSEPEHLKPHLHLAESQASRL